jgi:hypothetical protein
MNVSGKVDVNAQHHGASATTADGKSSGGTAVGAAIALSFVDDSAKASDRARHHGGRRGELYRQRR